MVLVTGTGNVFFSKVEVSSVHGIIIFDKAAKDTTAWCQCLCLTTPLPNTRCFCTADVWVGDLG